MPISCELGFHNWDGCKCARCGKVRDEGHNWSKDCELCATCKKTRTNKHEWLGGKCKKCGKSSNDGVAIVLERLGKPSKWPNLIIRDSHDIGFFSDSRDSYARMISRIEELETSSKPDTRGTVKSLIETLNDGNRSVRTAAAEALGKLDDVRAVEPLIKMFIDSEYEVREAAAEALVKIGTPSVEPLIKALYDNDKYICSAAVKALLKFGDPRAVELLIKALGHSNYSVREGAAGALGNLGDPRAVEPLIGVLGDTKSVRKNAAEALAKLGETKWLDLVKGDSDDFHRLANSHNPRAVEPLINALDGESSTLRKAAAGALGNLGDPRAVEPLINALGAGSGDIRQTIVLALGMLGDPRAVEPVIKKLGDNESSVREAAAEALGKLGDVRAIEPLIKLLGDGNKSVQTAAAGALGKLFDICTVESLIVMLVDINDDVRRAAAVALEKVGEVKWKQIITGDLENDMDALAKSGDHRVMEPLIKLLEAKNRVDIQTAAAEALGKLGDVRAIEPLIKLLGDGSNNACIAAAEALGKLDDVRAVEPLIKALDYVGGKIRIVAAEALGKLGDVRAVEPLIKLLGDGSNNACIAAAEALGKLGDVRAVEPLVGMLVDINDDVRQAVAMALYKLGEVKWKQIITGNWNNDIEALVESGDHRVMEPTVSLLELGDIDIEKCVADNLVKSTFSGIDDRLIDVLKHSKNLAMRELTAEILIRRENISVKRYLPSIILGFIERHSVPSARLLSAAGMDKGLLTQANSAFGYSYETVDKNDSGDRRGANENVSSYTCGMEQVKMLCSQKDLWSSCILYLLKTKPDIEVSVACCGWSRKETLSCHSVREAATLELQHRGLGDQDPIRLLEDEMTQKELA